MFPHNRLHYGGPGRWRSWPPIEEIKAELTILNTITNLNSKVSFFFSFFLVPVSFLHRSQWGAGASCFFFFYPVHHLYSAANLRSSSSAFQRGTGGVTVALFLYYLAWSYNILRISTSYGSCHAPSPSLLWCPDVKWNTNREWAASIIQQVLS